MSKRLLCAAIASAISVASPSIAADAKPTIVLVHGAFADASSWNDVITELSRKGYPVVAAANPLRSVAGDAAYVAAIVGSIPTPVVLVGHSYGGTVISTAAADAPNVKALVFVSAFAPDVGESSLELSGRFPGGTLGDALAPPVQLPGGGQDLSIQRDRFRAQFAADVPAAQTVLMAVGQRPVAQAALMETSVAAAWKTIPSWSIYGGKDLNIPPAALAFMATRAQARKTVVIPGGSHVVMVSHPHQVADLIEDAAQLK